MDRKASTAVDLSKFKVGSTGQSKIIHTTTGKLHRQRVDIKAQKVRLEEQGLWGAPKGEASPIGLRSILKGDGGYGKVSFFPRSPRAYEIQAKVARLPESVVKRATLLDKSGRPNMVNYMQKWYGKHTGKAYIPMRSELRHTKELQVLIPAPNVLKRTSGAYYTKIDDLTVPVYKYIILL